MIQLFSFSVVIKLSIFILSSNDYRSATLKYKVLLTLSYLEIYLTSSSFGWYGYEWVKLWKVTFDNRTLASFCSMDSVYLNIEFK